MTFFLHLIWCVNEPKTTVPTLFTFKCFFQSQRELHTDGNLLADDEYDFSEQDNIQSEWVSYYYIPQLDMAHERELRKALVQCHQVKYIEMDHQTQHMVFSMMVK